MAYKTKTEILNGIKNNNITGVVELTLSELYDNKNGEKSMNKIFADKLIGYLYGYLLTDVTYEIVGSNIEKQVIYIKVTAATSLLLEKFKK